MSQSIAYFPRPLPDEILYSLIARYSNHTLETSPKRISSELFGCRTTKATLDLPGHLNRFQETLASVFPYSVDDIIEQFTLYPFYRPFLKECKRLRILGAMKENFGSTIHTRLGINASRSKRLRYPKFCPICVCQDQIKDQEAYWHRVHQIPDITICPFHYCRLVDYHPKPHELNQSAYIIPSEVVLSTVNPEISRDKGERRIADIYCQILQGKSTFDINNINYFELAQQRGYTVRRNLQASKLIADFNKHWGALFLQRTFKKTSLSWIQAIIKRPLHFFDPVRHVLMFEFFQTCEVIKINHNVFGFGPWKCLNKAAEHYNQMVVPHITHHFDNKSKRVVSEFLCSCGMVYTKSLIYRKGVAVEFTRIKQWGKVWMERLRTEHRNQMSFRSIAVVLGTDAKTVSRYLRGPSESKQKTHYRRLQRVNRTAWKNVMALFDRGVIKHSRNICPALYAWLYRNDKPWLLETNRYRRTACPPGMKRVDWQQLDLEMRDKLMEAVKLSMTEKVRRRITRTTLARLINRETYLIGKNFKKFPLCQEYLGGICESVADFQIRRVRLATDDLVLKNIIVTEWRIKRAAALPMNVPSLVERQIREILKQNNQ